MSKNTGKWVIAVSAMVLLAAVFYPHSTAAIPEWRIQVVDENGKPLAGVVVHQEWNDLEAEGVTSTDAKTTDADGWVVLPSRGIRESVALQIQDFLAARSKGRRSLISTHAFVCWQGQTGEIRWDDLRSEPVHRLEVRKAGCG